MWTEFGVFAGDMGISSVISLPRRIDFIMPSSLCCTGVGEPLPSTVTILNTAIYVVDRRAPHRLGKFIPFTS